MTQAEAYRSEEQLCQSKHAFAGGQNKHGAAESKESLYASGQGRGDSSMAELNPTDGSDLLSSLMSTPNIRKSMEVTSKRSP
jgi:hypothetical protein